MLIKEVKQGAKIDFEKTNITISKFKVSTNHWLSTLLLFMLISSKMHYYKFEASILWFVDLQIWILGITAFHSKI